MSWHQECRILKCSQHGEFTLNWILPFGRSWQFIGDPDSDCTGLLNKLFHEIVIPDVVNTVSSECCGKVQYRYLVPEHSCADPLSQGVGIIMWKFDPVHKTKDLFELLLLDGLKHKWERMNSH